MKHTVTGQTTKQSGTTTVGLDSQTLSMTQSSAVEPCKSISEKQRNAITRATARKIARKVLLIIAAYFFSLVPGIILMRLYQAGIVKDDVIPHLGMMVFYGNSCVNPFLYIISDKEIRTLAKRLLIKRN